MISVTFQKNLKYLIKYIIKHSKCNKFIIKYFKHSVEEYQFESDYKTL